jgi:hypothetical protein
MVEYMGRRRITTGRNICTCLLVEPPAGQAQLVGHCPGLVQDDAMGLEHRVNIARRPARIVGQRHRRPADDINVRDDPPAREAVSQSAESILDCARSRSGLSSVMRR